MYINILVASAHAGLFFRKNRRKTLFFDRFLQDGKKYDVFCDKLFTSAKFCDKIIVMKKKFLTILIILCLILGFGAFSVPTTFADTFLIEDGYFSFDAPSYLHAGDNVTIVGEGKIYVVDSSNKVATYEKSASKAIFENERLAHLTDGNLYVDDVLIASNVIDFDLDIDTLAYVDGSGIYFCSVASSIDLSTVEVTAISQSGFSSVAISGNGLYLKKDMGDKHDDVYFCSISNLTVKEYLTYCKNFDTLIFDGKLWGVEGNVLYDVVKNEKVTVSPYANAVSVHSGNVYYLADGCLYKNGVFTLGAGNDLSFPIAIESNANNAYVVDKNGISIFTSKNGKFTKTSTVNVKTNNIAVTSLPSVNVYYTVDSDVYLSNQVLFSAENTITDIAVDGANNVYYSTENETYKNNDLLYEIGGKIAIAPSKKDVYNLFNETVYKNGEVVVSTPDAIAIDVDGDGNVYALTNNSILVYDKDTNCQSYPHDAIAPVDLDISYEKNTLGCIAIADKYGHNVIFSSVKATLPTFLAKNVLPDEELLRTTLVETPIFNDLNKSEIIATLPASSVVLCTTFDLDCDDYLAYVSFKNGTTLVSGYLDKNALSPIVTGTTPRYETAVTLYDNVTLHSLPCGLQEVDNKFMEIVASKDTEISLLSKYNVFGADWYKAEYNGAIGYVDATQIQLGAYVPSIYPDTNAKLVKPCAIYDKVGGKFVEDTVFLAKDTEVQVVGVFDSNTEYTQIKYYDAEAGGTRTCYVKTDALKYDYVTFEQQFALIAVIVLSVSTILVIVIFAKRKRKRK